MHMYSLGLIVSGLESDLVPAFSLHKHRCTGCYGSSTASSRHQFQGRIDIKRIATGILVTALACALAPAASMAKQGGLTESCSTSVSEYMYRRGDSNFESELSRAMNSLGSNRVERNGFDRPGFGDGLDPGKIDTFTVTVQNNVCLGDRLDVAASGRCDYVGCSESLGPEYDHVTTGGTVSISVCSGNVTTSWTYTRQANGNFMVTFYQQRYNTTSCGSGDV